MRVVAIDLSKALPDVAGTEDCFIIIWWGDIPLGHLVLPATGIPPSKSSLWTLVLPAITPALSTYGPDSDLTALPTGQRERVTVIAIQEKLKSILSRWECCDPRPKTTISIVVPTCNRPTQLNNCLQSLNGLSEQPLEIIVVDNAPQSPAAREVVQQFEDICYIPEPKSGASHARNTGARHSHGDIIAFVDDDETVHPDWLSRLHACFAAPDVALATGLVLPAELQTQAQLLFEQRFSFVRGYSPAIFGPGYYNRFKRRGVPVWQLGGSGNMAIRKSAFEHLDGFDERLGAGAAGCSEDSELFYAVLAHGWCCRYEPRAVTQHYHRQSMADLERQLFSYMRGHVVALLIQYAKYHDVGNLVRLFLILPMTYTRYVGRALRGDPAFRKDLLRKEIAGCFSGFWFYFRNRLKV